MKKEDRDSNSGDDHAGDDYPAVGYEGSKKGGSILSRVALYTGVFLVLVTAVGGYYYLNYTRASLNRRISGNPSGLVRFIDIGGGEIVPSSREAPFIEGRAGETLRTPQPSSPDARVSDVSPRKDRSRGSGASETPSVRRHSPPPGTIPSPVEKGRPGWYGVEALCLTGSTGTLLGSACVEGRQPLSREIPEEVPGCPDAEDLPERERTFSQIRSGAPSSRSGLTGGELPILPDISDGGDRRESQGGGSHTNPGGFNSVTNRGELRVGSLVDGDAVTAITINEVRLKSGRTLKVTAQ